MTDLFPETHLTPSFHLRAVQPDDYIAFFEGWGKKPEAAKYLTFKCTGNIGDTKVFIDETVIAWKTLAGRLTYAVCPRESPEIIGAFSAELQETAVNIGYCFTPTVWGKGYATEVTTHMSDFYLSNTSCFRVWAICDVENIASARVLEKSGFTREGLLHRAAIHPNVSSEPRDCYLYAKWK